MYHSFKKSQWLSVLKIIVQQNKIHATLIKSCSCSLTCVLTLVTVLGGVTRVGKVCCNPPRAAAAVSAVTRRVIPVILLITVISSARTGIAGPAPPPPNLQPGRARGNSGVRETWTLFLRDQLSSSLFSMANCSLIPLVEHKCCVTMPGCPIAVSEWSRISISAPEWKFYIFNTIIVFAVWRHREVNLYFSRLENPRVQLQTRYDNNSEFWCAALPGVLIR